MVIDHYMEVKKKKEMSKGGDKSKNAVAAVVMLAMLSSVAGGCQPAEETVASASSEETTITVEDTAVSEETEETEEDYGTNGELEGQMDYMVLCSDYNDANGIPRREIEDASEIEDPDVRAVAESYMEQGYTVLDQEAELASWQALGDGEYMFKYGFYAHLYTEDTMTDLWVYKMNETLFDYFIKPNGPAVEVEDDGTVVRYINNTYGNSSIAEYNRETGFGTLISSSDLTVSTYLNDDLSVIESDAVRAAAEEYAAQGFDIYYLDVMPVYGYGFEDSGYTYGDGITVLSWDEPYTQFDVFEIDEDLFESFIASGEVGDEISREDDGTVISITTQQVYDDGIVSEYAVGFDRSTDLISIEYIDDEDYSAPVYDEDYYMPITENLDEIADSDLRALAQDLAADDYEIYRLDPQEWFLLDDYSYAGGFYGVFQDGEVLIDTYIFEGDEDILEQIVDRGWYGDEQSYEDDGNVITGVYRNFIIGNNGKSDVITTIEFDRDTGYITISTESPYAP